MYPTMTVVRPTGHDDAALDRDVKDEALDGVDGRLDEAPLGRRQVRHHGGADVCRCRHRRRAVRA